METPTPGSGRFSATPMIGGDKQSKWDQRPGQTPVQGGFMQTPIQGMHPMMTPVGGQGGVQLSGPYWQRDINDRNRYYTDEELDQVLPS